METMTLEYVHDLLASYGNTYMDAVHAIDAAIRERDRLRRDVSDMTEELLRVPSREEWCELQKRAEHVGAEPLRLADENARLNKIESLATEQRLQMEDVELYLMDVSQPDDEDAPWCDRMKSAVELLVQDCNDAVGQKNKAEAELAALRDAGHAKVVPSLLCGRTPDGRHYVLTGDKESVDIVSDLIAASEVKAEVADEMVDAARLERGEG